MLPGDGIGPEIVDAALLVLAAADQRFGPGVQCEHDVVGLTSLHRYGTTLRPEVLERAKATAVVRKALRQESQRRAAGTGVSVGSTESVSQGPERSAIAFARKPRKKALGITFFTWRMTAFSSVGSPHWVAMESFA